MSFKGCSASSLALTGSDGADACLDTSICGVKGSDPGCQWECVEMVEWVMDHASMEVHGDSLVLWQTPS